MTDIEKLRKETIEMIKDVLHNCDNENTIINVINIAIKEVADECVKNVLKLYGHNERKND